MVYSALEDKIPTWIHVGPPSYQEFLEQKEGTFSQLFAVRSAKKNLSFEIFSVSGQKIPVNIYRYHKNGEITYEIGRGLPEGLYIIKMSTHENDQYVKLIRFGY